jgi:hypothetical protein
MRDMKARSSAPPFAASLRRAWSRKPTSFPRGGGCTKIALVPHPFRGYIPRPSLNAKITTVLKHATRPVQGEAASAATGGEQMPAGGLVRQILVNDRLTRGLGDAEAKMLIEWLVARAEVLEASDNANSGPTPRVDDFCRRGRAISRFVWLWCHGRQRGAAIQLAASERFDWPLPDQVDIEPCEVMANILHWEVSAQATARMAA